MTLEVLIPIRNPTEVFAQTIDSLAAQTDKNFAVLISDNFSTQGAEHLEAALEKLTAAGIAARKIQPATELGRVEHWNWLHQASQADWFKPLFAGDWLEPIYMTRLHETIAANPHCRYVFCNGFHHIPGREPFTVPNTWGGPFRPPVVMQDIVLRFGMQFGPPSAAAYERTAYFQAGGYDVALPICADSYLFCKMAALFGAIGMPEKLFHFQLHSARFSNDLPSRQRENFRENIIYYFRLARDVRAVGGRIPILGFLRMLARAVRDHIFPR